MKVSVVIPTYNNEGTIAAAVESALAQEFEGGFEVIVVNDGSTDGTAEVLRGFGDRVKVVAQPNRGCAAARNAAVRNSTGEYLAFLDADDEWLPEKLLKTVSTLEGDSNCGLAYSDAALVDSRGVPRNHSYIAAGYSREPSLDDLLREWWWILPSTAVMRHSIFDRCGGFAEEFGPRDYGGSDVLMWIRARDCAPFHFIREQLVRYQLSDPVAHLAKRIPNFPGGPNDGRQNIRARSLVHGEELLIRLVRREYGRRARGLISNHRTKQAEMLTVAGMLAINQGNARFARDCYLEALKRRPLWLKLPFRLAWTLVPSSLARPIAAVLPRRIARALCGPPAI
jgi:glycosyltransferase involved in cell wall biosynthesis